MKRKIIIAIAAFTIIAIAFLGMWLDFQDMQALKWEIQDEKLHEGFSWLSNNTKEGEVVLAWWDYADGIEKIGHREVVIREASRNIKETIAGRHKYPWSWIEYELWYPYESEDKVRDAANFFIAENSTESMRIAGRYGAIYVLVLYPDDTWKFPTIVMAFGKNPDDYVTGNFTIGRIERREVVKKETVGMKMIYGDDVEGFEKVFDNERMRIYKLN
jgi:asparagine N-glycosylation enzyme membrane subunit Stt3